MDTAGEADRKSVLSEGAANMVENLALRIAERKGGRLTVNDLAPYLPMSLGLIESCLEDMADGSSVLADSSKHVCEYEFTAYVSVDDEAKGGGDEVCAACGADLVLDSGGEFCSKCLASLDRELKPLGESMGWPAQAVYEHEILYLAAGQDGVVRAEDLAKRSRYTLRNMRRKLDAMSLEGRLSKDFDGATGVVCYRFPEIDYPKSRYEANIELIRSHPASIMEEVQIRVTQILVALGMLVLALFVMAFLHVPFPMLIMMFVVGAPVLSLVIWRRRRSPIE